VSVGMPNGPNAEWFFGRNAERVECQTAGMPNAGGPNAEKK